MSHSEHQLNEALAAATAALELIAVGKRPDGTYNRSREACEQLAREALEKVNKALGVAPAAPQRPLPNGRVLVYTDGGCKGNPGPAGWGVVIVDEVSGQVLDEAAGFIGTATNQVAELVAALEGLSRVNPGADVLLISDSQYTLKGLSEWRKGWERNGWTNSQGNPVANKEHWQRLYAAADQRKVKTMWVKGHNGNVHNERCDVLAANAIASNNDI